MLTARCSAKSCLGALLLSLNPCLCKGAGASQGFSLSLEAPGPMKGSCRPLWQLCRLLYVPWLELLPTRSPCFHLEQLWSWMPPSGGEVGLSISLQYFAW